MTSQPLNIQINGDVVALWGAITGSIAIYLNYLSYKRDRAHIVISVQRDMKVIHGEPSYDPNKIYTCVNVANRGRRTITITGVGYVYMTKRGGAVLSDSMLHGSRELHEGKSADFLAETAQPDDYSEIAYFWAKDATGVQYRKYVAPFYKRSLYWLLDITRIRKKQGVVKKKKQNN